MLPYLVNGYLTDEAAEMPGKKAAATKFYNYGL
jgi:hypothetical protein